LIVCRKKSEGEKVSRGGGFSTVKKETPRKKISDLGRLPTGRNKNKQRGGEFSEKLFVLNWVWSVEGRTIKKSERTCLQWEKGVVARSQS